jgi:hypothetical protein
MGGAVRKDRDIPDHGLATHPYGLDLTQESFFFAQSFQEMSQDPRLLPQPAPEIPHKFVFPPHDIPLFLFLDVKTIDQVRITN